MFFDIGTDLFKAHAVHLDAFNFRVFIEPLFDQMIGAVALVGHLVFNERIIESGHMAGCHPGFRVEHDLGIDPDHIFTGGDHLMPPKVADVAQQFRAQRAVVIGAGQPAVDFGSRINEASPFGKGGDLFKSNCSILFHRISLCVKNFIHFITSISFRTKSFTETGIPPPL